MRAEGDRLRNRAVERFLIVGSAVVLSVHFSLTALADIPVSPLSIAVRPLLRAYIRPLFTQSWMLFAPDPIDQDYELLAQYRFAAGGAPATPWLNVTDALRTARGNPVAPLRTLDQILSEATLDMQAVESTKAPKTSFKPEVVIDPAYPVLAIAAAYATSQPQLRAATGVRLALLMHQFPRFNARLAQDDSQRGNQLKVYPWTALDRSVGLR